MKKYILLIAASLCLMVITSCGRNIVYPTEISTNPKNFNDVLDLARTRRENIIRPNYYQLTQLTTGRIPISTELYNRMFDSNMRTSVISAAEAIYDINIFFSVLSGSYGPYIYFGGDEHFLPIRDNIIETLHTQNIWDIEDIAHILHNKMSQIVNDGHFDIKGTWLRANYRFFSYSGQFDKCSDGFRNRLNGLYVKRLVLLCYPGLYLNLEDSFKLSMDESASSFFYSIVIPLRVQDMESLPYRLTVFYENELSETIYLEMKSEIWPDAAEDTSLSFVDGFPIISVQEMGHPDSDEPDGYSARRFLTYAEYVRDEPVLILDLRNNMGGNTLLPIQWLYILTGEHIPRNHFVLDAVNYSLAIERFGQKGTRDPLSRTAYFEPFDDYHIIHYSPEDRIVPNKQLIVVLINRNTFSAAEGMVDLIFNIENTLVIGQNTGGGLLTASGARRMMLPHSGIDFNFGTSILTHPEGHFREGVGLAPDIWVLGDALTATLSMLNAYLF